MSRAVTIHLAYEPPLDWSFLLSFFQRRQSQGVELIENDTYVRTVEIAGDVGRLTVSQESERARLVLTIEGVVHKHAATVAERVRRLFDLDLDQEAVTAALGDDPFIGPLLAAHPGIRVPGAWSPFEMLARTIVGQQVSGGAATTIMGRIVQRTGKRVDELGDGAVTMLFPEPAAVAAADLDGIGMPGRRVEALQNVAHHVAEGLIPFPGTTPAPSCDDVKAALLTLPGIGPWTVECFALEAMRDPDAWPGTDLVLRRAVERYLETVRPAAAGTTAPKADKALLRSITDRWRPFRAYAAVHLWHAAALNTTNK